MPVCAELHTPADPIDALFVTPSGRLVTVAAKLWRNPEAPRTVIAQVLNYAKRTCPLGVRGFATGNQPSIRDKGKPALPDSLNSVRVSCAESLTNCGPPVCDRSSPCVAPSHVASSSESGTRPERERYPTPRCATGCRAWW